MLCPLGFLPSIAAGAGRYCVLGTTRRRRRLEWYGSRKLAYLVAGKQNRQASQWTTAVECKYTYLVAAPARTAVPTSRVSLEPKSATLPARAFAHGPWSKQASSIPPASSAIITSRIAAPPPRVPITARASGSACDKLGGAGDLGGVKGWPPLPPPPPPPPPTHTRARTPSSPMHHPSRVALSSGGSWVLAPPEVRWLG